jgi:hypothetical protein
LTRKLLSFDFLVNHYFNAIRRASEAQLAGAPDPTPTGTNTAVAKALQKPLAMPANLTSTAALASSQAVTNNNQSISNSSSSETNIHQLIINSAALTRPGLRQIFATHCLRIASLPTRIMGSVSEGSMTSAAHVTLASRRRTCGTRFQWCDDPFS